jgi:hypothetical protein
MKNSIVLILLFNFIISCNFKEEKPSLVNVDEEKTQINNILDAWHNSAAEANFEAYFDAMSTESVFIGTDAAEVWNLQQFKDFSKPFFDKGKAWSFKAIDRNVYLDDDGKIAWFDELLDTWMGVCRGSGVLKKTSNSWEIEQYVLSLTIPNDNIDAVIAVNKKKDSLFLKNLH